MRKKRRKKSLGRRFGSSITLDFGESISAKVCRETTLITCRPFKKQLEEVYIISVHETLSGLQAHYHHYSAFFSLIVVYLIMQPLKILFFIVYK